ncbi:hypothetical protein [Blastomonas aquatica]
MPRLTKAKPIERVWPKNPLAAAKSRQDALLALAQRRCLTFTYHGCYRVVGVFTVGLTQAGRPAMSAWQIDGQSNSGTVPKWGLFCFDECFDVALSDLPMPTQPADYSKGAKQFRIIDAEF